MPVRWQVGVELERPREVQVQHLHHHVCSWLEGPGVDHAAPSKPFAISPLWVEDGRWAFDIGLLDDTLDTRLAEALDAAAGRRLRFGSANGSIVVEGTGRLAACSWEELARQATPRREWSVEFVTPFATRRGRVVQPLPAAQSVFGHLHRRWREHAHSADGDALPAGQEPKALMIVESALDGRTSHLYVRGTAYPGFVGAVTYQLVGGPADDARSLDQLARLLPFSGAGTMTTFGMGVARLVS